MLSYMLTNGAPGLQVKHDDQGWVREREQPETLMVHVNNARSILGNQRYSSMLLAGSSTTTPRVSYPQSSLPNRRPIRCCRDHCLPLFRQDLEHKVPK